MRKAALVALALVLALPTAAARMTIEPDALALGAGAGVDFRIHLLNQGTGTLRFRVETEGDGLLVTLDKSGAEIPRGASVTLTATVRAPPWSWGEHTVRVILYEDDHVEPVETQEVRVSVTPGSAAPFLVGASLAVAGGTSVGFALWRRWHLLGLALYTRIQREHVERHPARARLVALVRAAPGISLADAQRGAGLANGPFEHHLRKLVDARRVIVEERGRGRHLRLMESGPVDLPAGTATSVAALVRSRGRVLASDVAHELGLSRQALHYHVRALAREGAIVARLEKGRLVLATP